MPFLSIIIPTFNSEKTLKQCLDSIVTQTFQDYEILLIDALSADSTIEILKEYSLNCPKINWVSEKDAGVYDAMNKGLKMAKGEWIYYLGSDDKLSKPIVLQEIFDFDKKDFDVIYGNVKLIGNTSWAKHDDIYDGEFDLKKLISKNICHQAILYKRQYLKNQIGSYNVNYKICADWDFNLRCWANKPFLYLDLVVADFYGGGLTSRIENRDDAFSQDFKINLLNYFGKKKLRNYLKTDDLKRLGIISNQSKISNLKMSFVRAIKRFLK